jgi:hypothetical protein
VRFTDNSHNYSTAAGGLTTTAVRFTDNSHKIYSTAAAGLTTTAVRFSNNSREIYSKINSREIFQQQP